MLGIELETDSNICNKLNKTNITDKIAKMATKLNLWSQRQLKLIGKVLITKSLGISNMVYKLELLQVKKGKSYKHKDSFLNLFGRDGRSK